MDPWLESHMRVAKARGSLTAPNSPVQDRILAILEMMDRAEMESDRLDALKMVILSSNPTAEAIANQFPERMPENWREQVALARATRSGEFDPDALDDSALEWTVPDEVEDDEISRWIRQRESGQVTQADLDTVGGGR